MKKRIVIGFVTFMKSYRKGGYCAAVGKYKLNINNYNDEIGVQSSLLNVVIVFDASTIDQWVNDIDFRQ